MGPYVDSIISDEVMPAATGVVVIGGGIVGTFAALTLANRGIPVVLCEKAYIACEQSSRNWGWWRQAGRDAREMPLIVQSLALWRDMGRLTESDTGFREGGALYVGENEPDEASFAAGRRRAGGGRPYPCGLHVPTDGCAEPQRATPAIARAAQRQGAIILAHCAVRGIELTAGRAVAVMTERG